MSEKIDCGRVGNRCKGPCTPDCETEHLCPYYAAEKKRLADLAVARREGKAKGLREAAKILLSAAQADERYASNTAAAHLRERHALLAENERVLETRLLARAALAANEKKTEG